MGNSTRADSGAKSRNSKATTPGLHPGRKTKFPLWLHSGTGQWTKKILGRMHYFGTDQTAALAEYVRCREELENGRPRPEPEGQRLTVRDLCNRFLTHKKHQVQLGELTVRSFEDYEASCRRMAEYLGKTTAVEQIRPDDLLKFRHKMAETLGPGSLGNEITRCRVVLNFAFQNGLLDRPVRTGEFKKPSKAATRRRREEVGPRLFEPTDLRRILDSADVHLRAMILLAANGGLGNADLGTLKFSNLDLESGWLDFPRRKTGVPRRIPLWPETLSALRRSIDLRRPPADPKNSELVFTTQKQGNPWYVDGQRGGPLSVEFRKLLTKLKLHRPGLSFYAIRHTFQTIGDEAGDYLAVQRLMGHADHSISGHYRERFSDDRLRRVTDHVRAWLFDREGGGA